MAERTAMKWLIGITASFVLLLCSILYYGIFLGRPPDEKVQPLTAEQLAQHPLLLPPTATGLKVTREIPSYAPDEQRPVRPRYLRRVALFTAEGSANEVVAFYQQAFTKQGWEPCFVTYQTPTVYRPNAVSARYHRQGTSCAFERDESIGFSLNWHDERTYRVEMWEILPAPLEWPEQQPTPTTTSEDIAAG